MDACSPFCSDCLAARALDINSESFYLQNKSTLLVRGTGAFYVTDNRSNLYIVTARYVVFGPDRDDRKYDRASLSQPCVNIALFGTETFKNSLVQIELAVADKKLIVEYLERRVSNTREEDHSRDIYAAVLECTAATRDMEEAKKQLRL
ncbi:hypothetical protein HOY82DRAFT_412668 [Tuber indicum]|nr:hypothetical protein HOY82DRAFT_412668 [Tuber indicum]